jgi:hypothetical protein
MVISWNEVKAQPHFQFREVAVQATQDAGKVSADKEDFVSLQFQMAVQGID